LTLFNVESIHYVLNH